MGKEMGNGGGDRGAVCGDAVMETFWEERDDSSSGVLEVVAWDGEGGGCGVTASMITMVGTLGRGV